MREVVLPRPDANVILVPESCYNFSGEHLDAGWVLLEQREVETVPAPIMLAHPRIGVALLELQPAWTSDLVERFRRRLDIGGFTMAFPGHLPVIHRRLRAGDMPHLNVILEEGFAFQDPISLRGSGDWCRAMGSLLMAPPPPAAIAPTAAPRGPAGRRLRHAALPGLALLLPLLWPAPSGQLATDNLPAETLDILAMEPPPPEAAGMTAEPGIPPGPLQDLPAAYAPRGGGPGALQIADPLHAAAAAIGADPAWPGTAASRSMPAAFAPPAATPEAATLLRYGAVLLALGDIPAARRFLERAAIEGSAPAASLLAQTYDAYTLAALPAHGLHPDPAAALAWYRRAAVLEVASNPALTVLETAP